MSAKVKIVGGHIKDCFAVKNASAGVWDTCWGPLAFGRYGDPIVTTTRRYGKGERHTQWLRFVCNDPNCHAELHIDIDAILHFAEHGI